MTSPYPRRWWGLGALALSGLVVGLDLTILNIALPTLATDLNASTGELQWFANAYNLVFAAALLPAGLIGDRIGRKKILLTALVLFGVASVICAYASSSAALIAGRGLLGLGAALMIPMSMSVITVLFSAEERPRAVTAWITANAVGVPLGPILGGWLLDNYWWGSVFLINIPVVLIALVAVGLLIPESRSEERRGFDVLGVLTSSAGLVALTYGIIQAGEKGWTDPAALIGIGLGLVSLVAFALWQRALSQRPGGQPLIELSLFRSPGFLWGSILATMAAFAMFGVLFTAPQYFQAVLGADALGTGLRLLPVIGGLVIGARVAGRLGAARGPRITVVLGFTFLTIGLFLGAFTTLDSGYGFVATWVAIIGIGLGLSLPTTMDAALGALSVERSGVGSALIQALRNVGGAVGVAVLGGVLNASYRGKLDLTGLPAAAAEATRDSAAAGVATAKHLASAPLLEIVRTAFVHGMSVMLAVTGAVAVVGVVLAAVFLPAGKNTPVDASEPRVNAVV